MSKWLIYWITRADAIQNLFIALSIVSGIILFLVSFIIVSVVYGEESPPTANNLKKLRFLFLWLLWIPLVLGVILTPSTKDLVIIYMLPKIANSEVVKEMPKDIKVIRDLGIKKIEKILED